MKSRSKICKYVKYVKKFIINLPSIQVQERRIHFENIYWDTPTKVIQIENSEKIC